ncbi:MAG: beta-propeller fold lactonase family protein, partial [Thermoguttaceae bacterium]
MSRILCIICLSLFTSSVFAADYKSPYQLAATKDGKKVYVLNHDADEIVVLDTANDSIIDTFKVGNMPFSMVLTPDEKTLYVTTGEARGNIEAINTQTGKVEKSVAAGHSPRGLSISPDGKKIYVCNRFVNSIAEFEVPELKKTGREFKTIREPMASAITPDGKTLFAINFLPNDPADSFDVASEVTSVDLASGEVKNIRLPNGSSSLHGICISPDGKYVYVTEILARYQMPTT